MKTAIASVSKVSLDLVWTMSRMFFNYIRIPGFFHATTGALFSVHLFIFLYICSMVHKLMSIIVFQTNLFTKINDFCTHFS